VQTVKASILMLTIDRYELTKKVFEKNLERAKSAGVEIEVMVADNGSQDRRIVEYFATRTAYHRVNSKNEGINKAFNQLFLRSTGDVICILGNDIEMPENWLKEALWYLDRVQQPGICGFDWGHGQIPPVSSVGGVSAGFLTPVLNRVFGSWILHRSLIDLLGLFHEGYGPYGIEDSDFNERVNRAGYKSFYHPKLKSQHLGWDVGDKSAYRAMKDESLQANANMFGHRLRHFDQGPEYLVEKLPPLREPL